MDSRMRDVALGVGGFASGMGQRWNDLEMVRRYSPFLGLSSEADPRQGLADSIAMSLSGHTRKGPFSWKGKEIDPWCLAMNTALAAGSDPVRLATKIHAQCEIHGFFEGEDRKWFARLIEEGIEDGIFREGFARDGKTYSMGWTELVKQLRKAPGHYVVMSYTVTDGFPDPPESWRPEVTDPDLRWAEWDSDLSDFERFHLALKDIREQEGMAPINSETLRENRFGHGLSLLDLAAQDTKKIEKALGIEGE